MILGLDPGPMNTAWVLWDGDHIRNCGISTNSALIGTVYSYPQFAVACEHLQCFGMAVGKEVFETAYWIGEFRAKCRMEETPFIRVMRSDVKMHFCQSMRSKDANIRQALIDRFGGKGTKKNPGLTYPLKADLWSAFAVAVFAWDWDVKR